MEYAHGDNKQAYVDFMDSKGYFMFRDIDVKNKHLHLYAKDFIFVKNGITVDHVLEDQYKGGFV